MQYSMDGSIELITVILGIDNSGRTILARYVRIELFERTLPSPLNLTQDKGEAGACHCKTKRSSKGGRRNREREGGSSRTHRYMPLPR